jgi:hypothetical protein
VVVRIKPAMVGRAERIERPDVDHGFIP